MIKHIVMWKLKQELRESSIPVVKQMIENLSGRVEGLVRLEVGINSVPNESACDLVFISVFEHQAALDAYQDHPDHIRIKEYLGPKRISRHQVDYEI